MEMPCCVTLEKGIFPKSPQRGAARCLAGMCPSMRECETQLAAAEGVFLSRRKGRSNGCILSLK